MDASNIVVPIWGVASSIASIAGLVVWVYTTFETKEDAKIKYQGMDARVQDLERTLHQIASDVSYIRGRLEPKNN